MSHNAKSKAKGISATSFFDLKAELVKQEADLAKVKATGEPFVSKKPEKKPTVWARQNKGVKNRADRDIELEAISRPTLESARAVLERKAKIYEKLRKGKSGGLNPAQYDALLVDFDTGTSASKYYESDSEDEDESLTVPQKPADLEDDPIVEYEDEFGRVRTARRSEVPRELLPEDPKEQDDDEDLVIHDPTNYFPTYQPSEERQEEIAKVLADANKPLNVHYDASSEVRAKGAGFYQFSADEETRKAQMEEMRQAREETEKIRKETGAEDIKPGEVEGMQEGGAATAMVSMNSKSKAMEKRKRELEERRQLLEAKRRKLRPEQAVSTGLPSSSSLPSTSERLSEPVHEKMSSNPPVDPFASLKAQTSTQNGKGKRKLIPASDADVFLEQLEQDLLSTKSKKRR